MSTTIRKACNIFLDFLIILLGIIILINVYSYIQIKILNKSYSSFFDYSVFEVQTGSMKPAISPSDVIIVKSDKNPNVNDIITYKKDNDFITHRVVEKSGNNYITKGDANKDEDLPKYQDIDKFYETMLETADRESMKKVLSIDYFKN